MKVPINCPICGGPLLNEFDPLAPGSDRTYLTKNCHKRLNHKIEIRACVSNNDYVDWIRIPYKGVGNVIWHMGTEHLLLNTFEGKDYSLPFFEPDFSRYNKLIKKLSLYLTFS